MTTSSIAADVIFDISCSVAFSLLVYCVKAGSPYLGIWEKLLFALGVKGLLSFASTHVQIIGSSVSINLLSYEAHEEFGEHERSISVTLAP